MYFKNLEKKPMLKFSVNECPSLIKKSLHEIFPAPEVVSSEKLALITLCFCGDSETGARKVSFRYFLLLLFKYTSNM